MNNHLDLQSLKDTIQSLVEQVSNLERQLQGTQPYPRQAAPPSSIMSSNGEFSTAEPQAASE